jgi:ankyrin repeat protein
MTDEQSPQERLEQLGIARTEENLFRYSAIGDALVVDLLLKSGIRVSAKNAEGRSALFLASVNGQIDIARRLIEQGSDPIDVVAAAYNLNATTKDVWDKLSSLASLATILFERSDSYRWRLVYLLL